MERRPVRHSGQLRCFIAVGQLKSVFGFFPWACSRPKGQPVLMQPRLQHHLHTAILLIPKHPVSLRCVIER